jgi:phosphatidylethanolamine-binding protein (PEBP) family uncharacterized protein
MRIWSDSFKPRGPIPAEFAMGQADGFARNRNPHLAWDEVPEGTRSFALLCIDSDAPTVAETVGRDDLEIPVEQPRTEFVHWTMVDMPADLRVHRYFFRLFALDAPSLVLPDGFTAADVFHAMYGHVLAETAVHGTYSLHPAPRG